METIALNQFFEPESFGCTGDTGLGSQNNTSINQGVIGWEECQESCLADL